MVTDSISALEADRSGDSVEVSRAWRRGYYRDAWQLKDRFVASSGGQVYSGYPDPYEAANSELEAEEAERGAEGASAVAKARDAKLKRLGDAWKNPFSPMVMTPSDQPWNAVPKPKPQNGGRTNTDAAYAAKLTRVTNAWSGGQSRSRTMSEAEDWRWRLGHL
jgi:hypothetical protein